jgi:type IVB pilus formation R64 PilN family outer membrane protein
MKLTGTISSGSGEGSSGLPEQSIATDTSISIWQEINQAVSNIVGERGTATFSPGTGTVTVAGSPSSVRDVEQYLRVQNRLRLRRVAVEVRVLSVSLMRGNSFNFNLDAVIENAINGQPFSYSSNTSGNDTRDLSAGIVTAVPGGMEGNNISAIVDGLAAVADDISVVHSGTLVTMSDQPAPLQVATKRAYVKSVQGAATDGATSTTIEPDVIDIGMSMNILPRVITQDKVMLRLAVGITDLVELREFESSGASVQLPEIESTGFLQNAILSSGETLIMAGFERNTANDTQVGTGVNWNMFPGGQVEYKNMREARVLLITAEVLPEQNVETISRSH